jgi:hypothetical protein
MYAKNKVPYLKLIFNFFPLGYQWWVVQHADTGVGVVGINVQHKVCFMIKKSIVEYTWFSLMPTLDGGCLPLTPRILFFPTQFLPSICFEYRKAITFGTTLEKLYSFQSDGFHLATSPSSITNKRKSLQKRNLFH